MGKYGILLISHGSRSAQWVRLVDETAGAVRQAAELPLFSSYLELVEGRLIQDGIDALEREGVTDIITVPLFISSGSTHVDEISYALGVIPEPALETELKPFRREAAIHLCAPIDDDPEVAVILYEKLRELSADPEREIVLLIGHGSKESGFHERWRAGMDSLAEQVMRLGGFSGADAAMLLPDEAAERVKRWQERRPDCQVLVSPLFLSEGYFTNTVIPSRLDGYAYRYNGKAMLPHPGVTRWIEGRIEEKLREAADGAAASK